MFEPESGPPTVADKRCMGPDCTRHPLLGCIIANNGTTPEVQARNFLHSLRDAEIHQHAGRIRDLTETEYRDWMRRLVEWEKLNSVVMPPRAVSIESSINK